MLLVLCRNSLVTDYLELSLAILAQKSKYMKINLVITTPKSSQH